MENKNTIKVYLTFTNKKGQSKKVHFLMDKDTYEMLQKVSQEEREKYMLEEYRWFCKQEKLQRKTQSINSFYDKDGELTIDDGYDPIEQNYKNKIVREILDNLSPDERELIIMYYFKNKTQSEIARYLNTTERTIRRKLAGIISSLKEKYNS